MFSLVVGKALLAALFGIVFGLLFGGALFYQTDYFSNFTNIFMYLTLPLVLAAFYVSKFKLFFVYPVIVALFGDRLSETSAFEWLGKVLSTSSDPQHDLGARLNIALMVAVIWLILAIILEGIYQIANNWPAMTKSTYLLAILIVLSPLLLAGFIYSGPSLLAMRMKSLRSYSKPALEGVNIKHVHDQNNEVTYTDETGKPITFTTSDNEVVIKTEDLYVDTFKSYEFGKTACATGSPVGSTQVKEYSKKVLPEENFVYAVADFELNRTQPPTPENAYKVQLYCFVVNGDRYIFQRDNRGTELHWKKYPAESIIKSIVQSKQELR